MKPVKTTQTQAVTPAPVRLIVAVTAFVAMALMAFALAAQTSSKALVDAAKARCEVGEQIDGYLGAVNPPLEPRLKAAVDEINIGRKALYTRLAQEQGQPVDVIAELTGARLVREAVNECVKDSTGAWKRR